MLGKKVSHYTNLSAGNFSARLFPKTSNKANDTVKLTLFNFRISFAHLKRQPSCHLASVPATDFQIVAVAATDAMILPIAKIASDSSSIALHPLHTNFTGATLVGYFSVVVY